MNQLFGTTAGTAFALLFGLIIIGGAMFAGGRPTDVPRISPKAILVGALVLILVIALLAWRISRMQYQY